MTIPVTATETQDSVERGDSLWRGAFRRLLRSPQAIVGAVIVALFVLVALFAPLLAPYEAASTQWQNLSTPYSVLSHSSEHLLGIDRWGSDMLTQLIYGARQSLVIGLVSTLLGLVVGAAIGLLAGAFGGWVDTIVMRVVDILLSIPSLLLAISIAAILSKSSFALMIAIGVAQVPVFARLLRGSMLSQGKADYVLAATALGLRRRTIVMGHVLPNSIGPTIVQATLNLATAVIEVAALSYLGLGTADPATAEWGRMIVSAQDRFDIAPWLAFYPGVCIAITALGFTLFGEALREALDPEAEEVTGMLLEVEDLSVRFTRRGSRAVDAVSQVSFTVDGGEHVGLVGESGSGKSVTSLAIMGLLPRRGVEVAGSVRLDGRELLGLSRRELNKVRGRDMAMVFQDPMTSLNPVVTIGTQLTEVLVKDGRFDKQGARTRAAELLERVGIPDPGRRLKEYPHQLSGGMRQRVLIAIALACEPRLLIADEPTTALDVTIQAQILELLKELVADSGTALVMITHDLGVVAGLCDQVHVMYSGRVVESADRRGLFGQPRHPYTGGLLASIPRVDTLRGEPLTPIPGSPTDTLPWTQGCAFAPRCSRADERCRSETPELLRDDQRALRCFHPLTEPADTAVRA